MVGETLKFEERSIRLDFIGLEFNQQGQGPKVKSSELTDIELKKMWRLPVSRSQLHQQVAAS